MNMTPAQIVDKIGRLRALIAPLAMQEDKLRKELIKIARHKPKQWDGRQYYGSVVITDALCYDVKKLDKFLTPLEQKKMKRKVHKETLNVRALKKASRRSAPK